MFRLFHFCIYICITFNSLFFLFFFSSSFVCFIFVYYSLLSPVSFLLFHFSSTSTVLLRTPYSFLAHSGALSPPLLLLPFVSFSPSLFPFFVFSLFFLLFLFQLSFCSYPACYSHYTALRTTRYTPSALSFSLLRTPSWLSTAPSSLVVLSCLAFLLFWPFHSTPFARRALSLIVPKFHSSIASTSPTSSTSSPTTFLFPCSND